MERTNNDVRLNSRDTIAIEAMKGLLASQTSWPSGELAEHAYDLATCMLEEKKIRDKLEASGQPA